MAELPGLVLLWAGKFAGATQCQEDSLGQLALTPSSPDVRVEPIIHLRNVPKRSGSGVLESEWT